MALDGNGNPVRVLTQMAADSGKLEWRVQLPLIDNDSAEQDTLVKAGGGDSGYLLLRIGSSTNDARSAVARYGTDGTLQQSEDFPGESLENSASLTQDSNTRLLAVLYCRNIQNYTVMSKIENLGSNLVIDGLYDQDGSTYSGHVTILNTDTDSLQTLTQSQGTLLEVDAAGPLLERYSATLKQEVIVRYDFSGNTLWTIPYNYGTPKVVPMTGGGFLALSNTNSTSTPDLLGYVTDTSQDRVDEYDVNGEFVRVWLPEARAKKVNYCGTGWIPCSILPVRKGYSISSATVSSDGNVFVDGSFGSLKNQGFVGLLDPAKAVTSP